MRLIAPIFKVNSLVFRILFCDKDFVVCFILITLVLGVMTSLYNGGIRPHVCNNVPCTTEVVILFEVDASRSYCFVD